MRAYLPALAIVALTACGSSSPSSPTPQPSPAPAPGPAPAPTTLTVTGRITETLTGAAVGPFSQTVDRLPALLTISAPGYITRQAYAGSAAPTVDLIKDAAPFSLDFYRQLVRNGYEAPTGLQPLASLTVNPSIYLETSGFTAGDVAVLEQAARSIVPIWSAGRLSVAAFASGPSLRPDTSGWITVETISDTSAGAACGRSYVGASAGHIWLNLGNVGCTRPEKDVLSHELGHALGFYHVADPTCLMSTLRPLSQSGQPCSAERYHASIAYSRQSGNRDPDNDAVTSTPLSVRSPVIVVD